MHQNNITHKEEIVLIYETLLAKIFHVWVAKIMTKEIICYDICIFVPK